MPILGRILLASQWRTQGPARLLGSGNAEAFFFSSYLKWLLRTLSSVHVRHKLGRADDVPRLDLDCGTALCMCHVGTRVARMYNGRFCIRSLLRGFDPKKGSSFRKATWVSCVFTESITGEEAVCQAA